MKLTVVLPSLLCIVLARDAKQLSSISISNLLLGRVNISITIVQVAKLILSMKLTAGTVRHRGCRCSCIGHNLSRGIGHCRGRSIGKTDGRADASTDSGSP
eukprot:TRINITY_DN5359_c0_g2_i1.p1 TRINITY_DN5359_c0_g2~~TRINITY_DN5359_c0_g2_i1.p1  ORF type:complete len:101 (+),score=11.31 TRINITY_DN5359_c0_g2_i1:56-358(+)